MSNKFDWSKMPMNRDGFVELVLIPQMVIRNMVAEAELVKLSEELKALVQRSEEFRKTKREIKLIKRIDKLNRLIGGYNKVQG